MQPRKLWRLPRPLVFQGTQPRSLWSLQQMVSPRCFLRVHLGGESVTTLLPENGTGSSLKASRAGASDHSPDESSVVWGVHGEGSPGRGRSASPCHLTLLSVNATELEGDKDFHRVWFSFLWGQPCVQRKGKWRLWGLPLVRFPTVPTLTNFQSLSGEEFVGTKWLKVDLWNPPWSFDGAFGFLLRQIFWSKSARKDRGCEFYLILGISFAIYPLPFCV